MTFVSRVTTMMMTLLVMNMTLQCQPFQLLTPPLQLEMRQSLRVMTSMSRVTKMMMTLLVMNMTLQCQPFQLLTPPLQLEMRQSLRVIICEQGDKDDDDPAGDEYDCAMSTLSTSDFASSARNETITDINITLEDGEDSSSGEDILSESEEDDEQFEAIPEASQKRKLQEKQNSKIGRSKHR
ncbi:hypothetical protein HOLleu_26370 [Holothuria leucospilota]|uniref:Uncharacterized protein n=1 Tax=Holothuria leucospilota TaxID=206669 RepID=A0A9Q1H2G0_HOLLE|nr:hypothetical protein HOLleu_26370 [Holothuria leucospilota]